MERKKQKKRGKARTIGVGIAALLLILCALALWLNRDRLSPETLRGIFSEEETALRETEPFTYEVGSGQVFAVSGNNLAVASSTGIQLLDSKGNTLTHEVFSMERPAVTASEKLCVFFDAGSTELRCVSPTGEIKQLKTEGKILSARVNEGGYLVLITEETGYKAVVTVFDEAQRKVFAWHSGAAYVLAAELSPNGHSLAAVYADTEGGGAKLFDISSEEPVGSYTIAGELFWDLRWLGKDRLCLLSERGLRLLDPEAQLRGEYDFAGRYLLDYDLGASYAALLLGEHRAGSGGALILVDGNGKEKGRRELEKDVLSLCAGPEELLCLHGDGLELYTQELTPINGSKRALGAKKALLRADGRCLLLFAYGAELAELR